MADRRHTVDLSEAEDRLIRVLREISEKERQPAGFVVTGLDIVVKRGQPLRAVTISKPGKKGGS